MTNTLIIEEVRELKSEVRSLSQMVRDLVERINQGLVGRSESDVFEQMANSPKFQAELKETLELYRKDPSQFSNPFETLRHHKANV
jgi:2-hydroxy-3-keto-5-methylthiopentenyl-1-phosphate phosphatase